MYRSECIDTIVPSSSAGIRELPTWRAWAAIGARKMVRDIVGLCDAITEAESRYRQRRHLLALDERMRKDIGLAPVDLWREAWKPFWQR